jgi:hypothetical protein
MQIRWRNAALWCWLLIPLAMAQAVANRVMYPSPDVFAEDFSAGVDYLGTRSFVDR